MRAECALSALTPDQQEQLYDWLESYPLRRVLEMVAAPCPEGFGLKTHLTTLRRFHVRARARFQNQLAEDLPEIGAPAPGTDQLLLASLQRAAAELSTDQLTASRFTAAAKWMLRLKEIEQRQQEIELTRERLQLEHAKFRFNAADAALAHYEELGAISSNSSLQHREKVQAAQESIRDFFHHILYRGSEDYVSTRDATSWVI
ncbi:MAG TPA: hypothetical protein VEH27_18970 [Methylomirabilota bacterium]|nr:hypothetical protein [Methylomirabilota bacterium]